MYFATIHADQVIVLTIANDFSYLREILPKLMFLDHSAIYQ